METKVINIFGNPGSGKSTIAAYLFTELKSRNIEVELVTETAKDLVWDEDYKRLGNQIFVFSTQLHRIETLVGKVKYVITDSPILMQIGYYKERNLPASKHFKKLCLAYNNKYDNINILLKTNKNISQIGRAEINLNPMKYISNMNFDFKSDCTKKEEILNYILEVNNENK